MLYQVLPIVVVSIVLFSGYILAVLSPEEDANDYHDAEV